MPENKLKSAPWRWVCLSLIGVTFVASAWAYAVDLFALLPGGGPEWLALSVPDWPVRLFVPLIPGLAAVIAFCVWIYFFHADCQRLFPDFPLTPGRALARFIVPGYNLWGMIDYQVILRRRTAGYPSVAPYARHAFNLVLASFILTGTYITFFYFTALLKMNQAAPANFLAAGFLVQSAFMIMRIWMLTAMHQIVKIRSQETVAAEPDQPGA
jgi:hypothetical protein